MPAPVPRADRDSTSLRAAHRAEPATLRPGGSGDDPAITWRGARWTYRDLHERISALGIEASRDVIDAGESLDADGSLGSGASRVVDISTLDLPEALAAAFAAAHAGSVVLVGDPGLRSPGDRAQQSTGWLGRDLPPGTWLVAATSGTSGRPRAICRAAASWAQSVAPLADFAQIGPGDRVGWTGPLHSTLHLHAAVHTLALGAHLTDHLTDATVLHCVPATLADLLRDHHRAPHLRTVIVAGDRLPDELAARARVANIDVVEYYGAAELSFVGIRRWPQAHLRPFPGVEVRIDSTGTLWARSPYLAIGYADLARPDGEEFDLATPLRRDADGFATVGDLAAASGTAEGFVIRGRGGSAITVGGVTVLAEDVEAALRSIPGVRAAAAVGVPHPRLGQTITAVVVLAASPRDHCTFPTVDEDLAAVQHAARGLLQGAARPHRFLAVSSLPRTQAGKIARAEVQAMVLRAQAAEGHTATDP